MIFTDTARLLLRSSLVTGCQVEPTCKTTARRGRRRAVTRAGSRGGAGENALVELDSDRDVRTGTSESQKNQGRTGCSGSQVLSLERTVCSTFPEKRSCDLLPRIRAIATWDIPTGVDPAPLNAATWRGRLACADGPGQAGSPSGQRHRDRLRSAEKLSEYQHVTVACSDGPVEHRSPIADRRLMVRHAWRVTLMRKLVDID